MTSKVVVTSHPGVGVNALQVDVVSGSNETIVIQTTLLKNNETLELYVYDDRKIIIKEVMISE